MAEQRVTEADIRAVLAGAYTPRGCTIWLYARNANLGDQRPIYILETDGATVLAEAERVAGAM